MAGVDDTGNVLEQWLARELRDITPYIATVVAVSSGLVRIQQFGAATAGTAYYPRLGGFDLAADDIVLVIGETQPIIIGRYQTSAPSSLSLGMPLKIEGVTVRAGVGSPEASVAGSKGDIYIQTDGSGSRVAWIKQSGSATTTGWMPFADRTQVHSRRLQQITVNAGATTVSAPYFGTAPTLAATLSNQDDSNGPMLRHTTGATSGNTSGMHTAYNVTRRDWSPSVTFVVESGASTNNVRNWIGLFESTPAASGAPSIRYAAFRWDYAIEGAGSNWQCCTDAATGTPTKTDSGIPFQASMLHTFRIDIDGTVPAVEFFIDDVLVARHTSNLPAASTPLGIEIAVTTETNQARSVEWSRIALEQK